ncbi:hypothetical protein T4B_3291 [Trichinella pseudospiralis]|uniref:EGF-like domain-containing protein n=2 Tax=Trichinella pseudospiralis TaxID=6337 RepID=A0A0V1IGV9_TRIPS|nr:hypothetical protein T4B_3291 [Trichinella pseudospiralis]KRZ40637.1 hypothetical protein T4C_3465 [Trichinella pseudospiralis]
MTRCAQLFSTMLKRGEMLLYLAMINFFLVVSSNAVEMGICPYKVAENVTGMQTRGWKWHYDEYEETCLTFKMKSNSTTRDRSTTLKWFRAENDACLEMFPDGRVSPLQLLTNNIIEAGNFPANVTKTIITADIVSMVKGPVLEIIDGNLIELYSMYRSVMENGEMVFKEKSCYYNKVNGISNCESIDRRLTSRTQLINMSKDLMPYCGMAELKQLNGTIIVTDSWLEPCSEVLRKTDEYICAHRPYLNCDYLSRTIPCHTVNNSDSCIEETNYYIWRFNEKPYGQACPENRTTVCNCSTAITLNLTEQWPICKNGGLLDYRPDGSIFCWCDASTKGKGCEIQNNSAFNEFLSEISFIIVFLAASFIIFLLLFLCKKMILYNRKVILVKVTPTEERHAFEILRFNQGIVDGPQDVSGKALTYAGCH